MTYRFVFIDDSVGITDDASTFQHLLSKADELEVELSRPDRSLLLVPEAELEPVDGFILDINLRDHVEPGAERFKGSGAGLAQDLRLMQTEGPPEGQRPRPIVRLCAAQVFQRSMEGDSTLDDVFDLGFNKETIADVISDARRQIAALVPIYEQLSAALQKPEAAADLLGLSADVYHGLPSAFRAAFEGAICKRVHEAAHFMLADFLIPVGLLVDEATLAVRLGIDRVAGGWSEVREAFSEARYTGAGESGFERWWATAVQSTWLQLTGSSKPLHRLTAQERVRTLAEKGFEDLVSLVPGPENPGERPWSISVSDDPELRRPVDPAYSFPLSKSVPPWVDEQVWSFEMAKRHRRSSLLSDDMKERLARNLRPDPVNK